MDDAGTGHRTLYDGGDYTDVDEFMDRYREDFGEDITEEQAWELLAEQDREDLEWVVEDVDALLSQENPDGALMVRGVQRRWNGLSSGFSDPYGSFASLMGDTGRDGLFKDCEAFRVYVEGGSLFVDGIHHDGRVSVEARALAADQLDRFDDAADAFLRGHPEPMNELWGQASRIDVQQGGLTVVAPEAAPSAQDAFERSLSAASAAGPSPARARSF